VDSSLLTRRLEFIRYVTAISEQAVSGLFYANNARQHIACMQADSDLYPVAFMREIISSRLHHEQAHPGDPLRVVFTFLVKAACYDICVADRLQLVNVQQTAGVVELCIQKLEHLYNLDRLCRAAYCREANNVTVKQCDVLDAFTHYFFTFL